MLKIHFINVGEGDAILLEYMAGTSVYRMIVDTGDGELPLKEGSLRRTASEYLREAGITHLDMMVLTHLHMDHIGDLEELGRQVSISRIYSSYIPKDLGLYAKEEQEAERLTAEIIRNLKYFAKAVGDLKEKGSVTYQVLKDEAIFMNEELKIELLCANQEAVKVQNLIYDNILGGISTPGNLKHWAAAARNPNSLRVVVTYAGRRIELDGDYYSDEWEKQELLSCDILKVSHHGDRKGMTPCLAGKLKPRYAVISCQGDYVASKDRPSRRTADCLRDEGAEIYYTDCFAGDRQPPCYWKSVIFKIMEDGTILCPDRH